MASQQLTNVEEEKLKDSFNFIDTNRNGLITQDELISGYKLLGQSEEKAKEESEWVMKRIDLNQNGMIDYNEFLMANLISENSLTEQRLQKAFQFFDLVCINVTIV